MKKTIKLDKDVNPLWARWIYAWQKNWHGILSIITALVVTPIFWPTDGDQREIAVLLVMNISFISIFVYAMVNYFIRHHYSYTVHGIEIQIRGEEIPQDKMFTFLAGEIARWQPWAVENDFDLEGHLETYTIRITDNPPVVPVLQDDGEVSLEEVVGAAWPHKNFAMIWDKHALDTHGMGHELDHLLSEDAHPGIPTHEEETYWLKAQGIRS